VSGWRRDDGQLVSGARERFLESDPVDGSAVRGTILESWRRSKFWGVPVDELAPPYRPETETDSRLVHAARPVLDRLETALAGVPMSVILTDAHGCVLERRAGEPSLNKHLDMILLAPGFSYAEEFVGTNGIGTAIELRRPSRVFGSEHFSERLQLMSCAGTPIRNVLNGRLEGVIDLTSWRHNANSLMQALSQEAAAEIEELLVQQRSEREQALLREFLAVTHRTAKAVLALSDDIVMTNDAADRSFDRADHVILREKVADLSVTHDTASDVVLSQGQAVRLRCRPVSSPTGRAGAVVEITPGEVSPRHHGISRPPTEPLPGVAGQSAAWIEACKHVEAHCREQSWLLVVGESGVGKLALIEAAHRRWYPRRRLTVLECTDLAEGVEAWAARLVPDDLEGTIVLRHLDQLSAEGLRQLDAVLQTLSARGPWIVGTVHSECDVERQLGKLLYHFAESTPLPPLRHRIEDVVPLVAMLLQRHASGRSVTVAPEATQNLLRGAWPGNVAELEQALRSALARRHTGQITLADLPESCHATSRRVLTEWECIERDAIIRALRESGGDKIKAAVRLGISRATIYRKIRTFGIIIDPETEQPRDAGVH
jgi:sigma-54 dependent transcriptional regulator, acetoin dehydrogenase operon transcriptional activator AcoR